MQGGVRGAGCWVWAAWRASESLPEKGLTRVCHWWLERDSRQGWVQHMLPWPKGSLRTNERRMPSSGATLTSKLGSICRSRSRCLCLHFSFGFPSRFPSFCPSYCCFGIFLHSNHFKEAARLLQLPCNSFCWLPISTSEAQRKEAATSAAEREPASREKRQQQDKPLKGYQDMTSSAPRQIVKGWERETERERENELRCDADKHTQMQLNSPHSQPRSGSLGCCLSSVYKSKLRPKLARMSRHEHVCAPANVSWSRQGTAIVEGDPNQRIYKILEK